MSIPTRRTTHMSSLYTQLALVLLVSCPTASSYTFLSIGDWGANAIPDRGSMSYQKNVGAVASQLTKAAEQAEFVLNLGDSFYWCGIQNTSDFQVQTDFLEPYKDIKLDWYGVLGNHEYGYNVSAVLDLNNVIDNWVMEDRYYSKRVAIDGTNQYLTMIFIDTSPCVSEFRATSSSGYDPCGTMYPTCSLSGGHDDFEGSCQFHQNVISQDCSKQFSWFKETLSKVSKDDWLIVLGHQSVDELDVEDFTSAMQSNGFDLYINGHAHTLSQYTVDSAGAYITTGAGSLVSVHSSDVEEEELPTTPAKLHTYLKTLGHPRLEYGGHTYETVWNSKVAGFTRHQFNKDASTLTTDFVSYEGTVVHSFTIKKRGQGPSPSPPVPPSPAPSKTSCCHSSDASCTKGQVCCKSSCNDPNTCSYTESGCTGHYGSIHNCVWKSGNVCVVE